ncbi:alkene reductase [Christiangramia flava]|uniref:Flavoprotein NADH-dependent oxidoreductase n=1 Tax=Christiangramia flava JLT2011 TaxID=1229726 RepID=A0A1L7I1C3_9FLAO|nr:alkene reductase [Christiangramia flava]APU67407.1 Flavoprotein NADH-dependent oxidoreductase [Christiangramia flava JLT2011]OSS39992.1 Flavoprotein NADH-dependent oxidoreductase [Christiangramia flava JLT2011]
MENENQPLLQTYQLGNLKLKNRVVMAPMTRSRADNDQNAPTDLHATYYRQRAGAGLIITEGSQVSERAVGYINTPGIHTEEQVEGWKKVTEAVHEEGGKIFIQLWHCGRISHPKFHNGDKPLAPSAVNPEEKVYTPDGFEQTVEPQEMSRQEIQETVQEFKHAAVMAKNANFDGVEIHSSNGYLFHQFFNSKSNLRKDDYGGDIANRARFFFEVLEAIAEVWPENQIGCRFNPSLNGVFGITATEDSIPTFDHIIEKLNAYDLAYVHLSEPFTDVSDIAYLESEIAKHYRGIYKGTLMINAGFDQESGNKVIEEGDADLVSFGKLFISNPDLPERFKNNWPLADWDADTFYTPGEKGYTDYPAYEKTE